MSTSSRLKDVAAIAGVDISTASTILGNKPKGLKFSEATRQRIFMAAEKLNYQPNAAAKALATRRTGTIGLTLHDQVPRGWANQYFAGQLVGVEEVCRSRGYGLHINLYDFTDLKSFVFPKNVQERAVDGVILAGYVRSGIFERFRDFGVPVVCIGENHDVQKKIPIVRVDHVAKAMEAIRYSVSLGHRRICYVALPTKQKNEIAAQVRKAVANDPDFGSISFEVIAQVSHADVLRSGDEILDQVTTLSPEKRPTVLIFTTLDDAIGTLRAMRARGLKCPEDLSLIADNDDDICDVVDPPLTAMGQDLRLLGKIAANALIDWLEAGGEQPSIAPTLARPLTIRSSVAKLTNDHGIF